MAGHPTVRGASEILRAFFSRTATPPPALYLALIREIPANAFISGDELDEPIGAGYARAEIINDLEHWSSPFNNSQLNLVSNQLDVEFPTALDDWGNVGYWALCNAPVEGYVFFYGQMEGFQKIMTRDQAVVPAHELVIEFAGFTQTVISTDPDRGSDSVTGSAPF